MISGDWVLIFFLTFPAEGCCEVCACRRIGETQSRSCTPPRHCSGETCDPLPASRADLGTFSSWVEHRSHPGKNKRDRMN